MKYDARASERAKPEEEYTQGTNERLMRYAEVLLLAAEAAIKTGNSGKGAEYIQVLRNRAGYEKVATGTMEEIEYERIAELAFEGHRWYDLRRWGKLDATLTVFSAFENAKMDAGELNTLAREYKPKNAYFPIPTEELQSNPNLTQNHDWE